MYHNQVLDGCTLDCTFRPWQKDTRGASQRQRHCTQRSGCPCNVHWRGNSTSECHGRQPLFQEPSRANFTCPSPLRRRTSTDHDYIHAEVLQTARWRCASFGIIAKLAPLWRHRSKQSLSIHSKRLSRTHKHNLCKFRIEYRSRVLCITIKCWTVAFSIAH